MFMDYFCKGLGHFIIFVYKNTFNKFNNRQK